MRGAGNKHRKDGRTKVYEHTESLDAARQALVALRKNVKRLHFVSGGRGYDNMGRRELEQLRVKLDEADHWLAAASGALNAGGKRAVAQKFWPPSAAPKGEITIVRELEKIEVVLAAERELSDDLSNYKGRWVAVAKHKVVAFADTLGEVLMLLADDAEIDGVWQVPEEAHGFYMGWIT